MDCYFNQGKLKLWKDSDQHKAIITNTRGTNKHETQMKTSNSTNRSSSLDNTSDTKHEKQINLQQEQCKQ